MATHTLVTGEKGSYGNALTESAVDTVTIEGVCEAVEVTNETGSKAIYFTTDGSTPTVKGANCHEIPAIAGRSVKVATESIKGENTVVKLIAAGTPEYSVDRSQILI
jgi:hypothetical protein